jgi:hypothetical protein
VQQPELFSVRPTAAFTETSNLRSSFCGPRLPPPSTQGFPEFYDAFIASGPSLKAPREPAIRQFSSSCYSLRKYELLAVYFYLSQEDSQWSVPEHLSIWEDIGWPYLASH